MSSLTNELFEEDLVTLVDEDGKEHDFEIADIVEFEDKEYALLLPYKSTDPEQDEVLIMRYTEDKKDCISFIDDKDEDEFQRLCTWLVEAFGE